MPVPADRGVRRSASGGSRAAGRRQGPAEGRAAARASTAEGPGRLLIAVYAVFALAATGRSTAQLVAHADRAPLPYALSAAAGAVYIAATAALAAGSARARRVAWAACLVELVGVLTVGCLSLARRDWFGEGTVWSVYGQGYGFVPLLLPIAGLAWLRHTARSR